jgi:hypothetical protein
LWKLLMAPIGGVGLACSSSDVNEFLHGSVEPRRSSVEDHRDFPMAEVPVMTISLCEINCSQRAFRIARTVRAIEPANRDRIASSLAVGFLRWVRERPDPGMGSRNLWPDRGATHAYPSRDVRSSLDERISRFSVPPCLIQAARAPHRHAELSRRCRGAAGGEFPREQLPPKYRDNGLRFRSTGYPDFEPATADANGWSDV